MHINVMNKNRDEPKQRMDERMMIVEMQKEPTSNRNANYIEDQLKRLQEAKETVVTEILQTHETTTRSVIEDTQTRCRGVILSQTNEQIG